MFINEPVLKGAKKKTKTMAKNIKQYQFSSPPQNKKNEKSIQEPSKKSPKKIGQVKQLKAKMLNTIEATDEQGFIQQQQIDFRGQTEFQDNLVFDLRQLLKKWEEDIKIVRADLKQYEFVSQSQSQIRAFQHCISLLQAQYNNAQAAHESTKALLEKKILQVDDYKLRLVKQIQQLHNHNRQLIKENQKLQQEERDKQKQMMNKKVVQQRIDQQSQKIQKLKSMLLECKQKSYQQKNQFIQLQGQQFKIEKQLNQIDQIERKHQEQEIKLKKYNQLLKIKQKIIYSKNNIEDQIRPHLERKIQKMAKLRSELNNLDEALQTCCTKVEDQNIIVEALKQKAYHEQVYQPDEENLYQKYRKKYSQIYFGTKSNDDSWKDYNTYLKHLINKNKQMNAKVYTQIPEHYSKRKSTNANNDEYLSDLYGHRKRNTQLGNQILDLRPNFSKRDTRDKFYGNSTKISQNPQRYRSQRIHAKKIQTETKLPRLVKIEGKAEEQAKLKNKVKEGILKNNNKQSDFELQSMNSNDSKVSGEIIQVQFHKK